MGFTFISWEWVIGSAGLLVVGLLGYALVDGVRKRGG
jgi:hypothetical protein